MITKEIALTLIDRFQTIVDEREPENEEALKSLTALYYTMWRLIEEDEVVLY